MKYQITTIFKIKNNYLNNFLYKFLNYLFGYAILVMTILFNNLASQHFVFEEKINHLSLKMHQV